MPGTNFNEVKICKSLIDMYIVLRKWISTKQYQKILCCLYNIKFKHWTETDKKMIPFEPRMVPL